MAERIQESFVGQWIHSQRNFMDMLQANLVFKSYIDMYNDCCNWVNDFYKSNCRNNTRSNDYFVLHDYLDFNEKLYLSLKNFYEDIIENIYNGKKNMDNTSIYNIGVEEYMTYLSNSFVQYLPQPIKNIFEESLEVQRTMIEGTVDAYKAFFNNSFDFQRKVIINSKNSNAVISKYLNKLNENLKISIENLMGMTNNCEINNELFEMHKKNTIRIIDYYRKLSQYNENIIDVCFKNLQSIMDKYQSVLSNGFNSKSFEELNPFWWNVNKEAYKELFNSDDFYSLIREIKDASEDFKTVYENFINLQLEKQPFATKKDLESLKVALGNKK